MYGNQNNYYDVQASRENVSGYLVRTYRWMFLGLLLTFAVSYLGFATGFVWNILSGPAMVLLTIAEFGVVIYLSARINQMAPGTATALFFAYAALNGLVFSIYFLVFDAITMIFAFAVAALYFGVMAVYGSVTKKDLSGMGSMLFCGLIALLVFSLLSAVFFVGSSVANILIGAVGLVIFMGLTVYDTQKVKAFYYATSGNEEMAHKASIYGALQLYLDFINIFLYVLRFVGRNRNNN